MKKVLKLLSGICIFSCMLIASQIPQANAAFLFGSGSALLNPTLAPVAGSMPKIPTIPGLPTTFNPIFAVPTAGAKLQQMKYNPTKGGLPRALQKKYNTKKEAYEAAKRAGNGKEPRHDPNGHDKKTCNPRGKQTNKRPHYHPNVKGPEGHDHYYYHRVIAGETLSGIAKKHHTTYQKLASINGIKNPNLIRVGQNIKIPK